MKWHFLSTGYDWTQIIKFQGSNMELSFYNTSYKLKPVSAEHAPNGVDHRHSCLIHFQYHFNGTFESSLCYGFKTCTSLSTFYRGSFIFYSFRKQAGDFSGVISIQLIFETFYDA